MIIQDKRRESMARQINRRKFLSNGPPALLAAGAVLSSAPAAIAKSAKKSSAEATDYYKKLGVTPLINAAGTYTVLSASTMPDEVQAAIALASKSPVNLN